MCVKMAKRLYKYCVPLSRTKSILTLFLNIERDWYRFLFCISWVCYFTWGRFLNRKVERLRPSPNICASNSCEKVGRRRTAQLDRVISMKFSLSSTFMKSTPGVNFIKVGRKVQIIEIALSICALRLRPTFWEAFYWRKSWVQGRRAQKSSWNQPQVCKDKN